MDGLTNLLGPEGTPLPRSPQPRSHPESAWGCKGDSLHRSLPRPQDPQDPGVQTPPPPPSRFKHTLKGKTKNKTPKNQNGTPGEGFPGATPEFKATGLGEGRKGMLPSGASSVSTFVVLFLLL